VIPRRRRIDAISDPAFLSDIDQLPPAELRQRRRTARDVENELSYQRRLIHARLDIIAFERRRRTGTETRSVLEALDEILSDAALPARNVTAVTQVSPASQLDSAGRRTIDRILDDLFITHLPDLEDSSIDDAEATLRTAEAEIAAQRRTAQHAYDALGAEMSRRYRLGLTSVDELLRD
jgi:hypothetical protein